MIRIIADGKLKIIMLSNYKNMRTEDKRIPEITSSQFMEFMFNKIYLYILFYDNKAITCLYMEPYI